VKEQVMIDLRVSMILACGLLLSTSGAISRARADEASDYLAAAGDEANALGDCTGTYARHFLTSQQSADDIAEDAFAACKEKVFAITKALQGAPTNLTRSQAGDATQEVVAKMKTGLTEDITKWRAGNQ
jgi:hypothetical protein